MLTLEILNKWYLPYVWFIRHCYHYLAYVQFIIYMDLLCRLNKMIHNSWWSRHMDDFEIILTHKTPKANSLGMKNIKCWNAKCDKVALYLTLSIKCCSSSWKSFKNSSFKTISSSMMLKYILFDACVQVQSSLS